MSEPRSRILVVDDEPQILRVLRRGLESRGFDVSTAPDAATALDIFKSVVVNLLVTDLRMPDMGGVELCRRAAPHCSRGLAAADLGIAASLLSSAGMAILISVESNLGQLNPDDAFGKEIAGQLPVLRNELSG